MPPRLPSICRSKASDIEPRWLGHDLLQFHAIGRHHKKIPVRDRERDGQRANSRAILPALSTCGDPKHPMAINSAATPLDALAAKMIR